MKQPIIPKPVSRKKIEYHGKNYWLNIMPEHYMHKMHLNGFATNAEAYISESLPKRARGFVTSHEIYHLNDSKTWLGYFGLELRANVMCGIKDPIGLSATIIYSIKDGQMLFYIKALLGHSFWS